MKIILSTKVSSPTKGKKRQSSEGVNEETSQKKSKENENDENIFNQRQNSKFVVPSNAGCTPKKVGFGGSSLSVSLEIFPLTVFFYKISYCITRELESVLVHRVLNKLN